MVRTTVPPRIRWGVDLMDVQPADSLLEIGCGPGIAAELVCQRLTTGKLFCIDRSESGVDRTKRRNQAALDSGRLTVRQIDLATLRVPVKRLTKAFAFNVNLFWVRDCADEVALLHEKLQPGGSVFLFFETGKVDATKDIVDGATRALSGGGFRVAVTESRSPASVAIVGRR